MTVTYCAFTRSAWLASLPSTGIGLARARSAWRAPVVPDGTKLSRMRQRYLRIEPVCEIPEIPSPFLQRQQHQPEPILPICASVPAFAETLGDVLVTYKVQRVCRQVEDQVEPPYLTGFADPQGIEAFVVCARDQEFPQAHRVVRAQAESNDDIARPVEPGGLSPDPAVTGGTNARRTRGRVR